MANTLEETLLPAFATVVSLETFPLNNVESNSSFCNLTHPYLNEPSTDSRLTRTLPRVGIILCGQ